MKGKRVAVRLLAIAVLVASVAGVTYAATPEEIEESIGLGLTWLADQQNTVDGGWGTGCDRVARTGLAVLKFNTYAIEMGMDPLDEEYEYYDQVSGGLDFIMTHRNEIAIAVEPAGDPDGNGNGVGVYFADCNQHEIYNTGIAMMALATSRHPETYGDDLQDAVDFMAYAQADPECGAHRGGWRYGYDYCESDNSNSGYATLGLGFAQYPPPYGFGLTVPQWVKDELSIWIDEIQVDASGCSLYAPGWAWPNILKQGNLLYEMALVGDTVDTPRVQAALECLVGFWDEPGCEEGWQDHRQAMFTMMKGFEALSIDVIDYGGDPEYDWFDAVSTHLVATQVTPDGYWPVDCWGGDTVLSTAWALLTLERVVPPSVIPVPFDIKPGSCPNPFNVGSKGVLPVAILGTEELDVTTIDPASIRLTLGDPDVGVAPLRWSYEDVGTPFEGELCDCHDLNGDGYMDLALKFDTQEVESTLGLADHAGETIPLVIIGNLMEDYGGSPIEGADCVWVLEKSKKNG